MFWAHFRQSWRAVSREPGFAAFAVLTLALGVGASTAMFSVFHGVLLAPVQYADPERVVAINTRWTDSGRSSQRVSGGDWIELARRSDTFEALGRFHGGEVGIQLRDRAEWADTYWVSPAFFAVFGAAPAAGRTFAAEEAGRALVLSDSFARRIFGDRAKALGQVMRIDTQPHEVVGVMPAEFRFPAKADIWVAAPELPENRNRTAFNYRTVARLRAGVSIASARAALEATGHQLAAAYPENRNKTWTAAPVHEDMSRGVRSTVVLLMGAVVLLLLISCANVAHLLIARAAARNREFALRAALGAGRGRLILQVLIESLVLGIGGGVAGMGVAWAGIQVVRWMAPENLPRIDGVGINWTVLLFGCGVAVASSLVFGLAPAWHASRRDIQRGLRALGSRGLVGGRPARMRDALVACEIALSFTLALAAGLLIRSFADMQAAQLGYRTEGLLVAYAHAPANTIEKMRASTRFFETALAELERMPGVVSAAAAMGLPAGRYGSNGKYGVEGVDPSKVTDLSKLPDAGFRLASANYFATLGIPLLRGRDFDARDQYDAPFVAIISQSLANQSFPGVDPIGKRIICGLDSDQWMTIVGVAGDVRSDGPERAPGPELYMPFQQHPVMANELQVVVRAAGAPEAWAESVVRKIRSLNPEIALKTTTMRAMLSDSVATPRFRTFLVAAFAGLALLLAMSGVYGVMAYLVSQRTPELGLRMALGSAPSGVVGLVLRRAGALMLAGLVAGTLLATASSRLLESLLYGVKPNDALGYAAAAAFLAIATACAAALPAWRASRIDPAVALREE